MWGSTFEVRESVWRTPTPHCTKWGSAKCGRGVVVHRADEAKPMRYVMAMGYGLRARATCYMGYGPGFVSKDCRSRPQWVAPIFRDREIAVSQLVTSQPAASQPGNVYPSLPSIPIPHCSDTPAAAIEARVTAMRSATGLTCRAGGPAVLQSSYLGE